MSYTSQEESLESGQPIELYLFQNVEDTFAYTSGQESISFGGNTYVPRPISRTEPEVESRQSDRNLVIKMPLNDEFVQRYVITIPATPDELIIYRFHSTDGGTPEVVTFFRGEVSNVAITGSEAKINILSNGRMISETITKQTFRNPCSHILYDLRCAVVQNQYRIVTNVTGISADGLSITVDGGANVVPATSLQLSAQLTADASFFNAGFVRRDGIEYRMVLTSTDNGGNSATFTVLLPFETLEVGATFHLFAGCAHDLGTCISKFSNHIRYGGFPSVPGKNPFEVGVDR